MKCWRWLPCAVAERFLQPRAHLQSGAGPRGPASVATSTNPRFRFTPWSSSPGGLRNEQEVAVKQIRVQAAASPTEDLRERVDRSRPPAMTPQGDGVPRYPQDLVTRRLL